MPENTIFSITGVVERDIRQAYTGGAVDVYIPHNHKWVVEQPKHNESGTFFERAGKTIKKIYL